MLYFLIFSFGLFVPYSSLTLWVQPKLIGIHNLITFLNYLKSKKLLSFLKTFLFKFELNLYISYWLNGGKYLIFSIFDKFNSSFI